VLAVTAAVVTVKVADVAFAAIVTAGGTVTTAVLALPSVTVVPLAGARPVSVTVAVEELPPITVAGFKLSPLNVAGLTVRSVDAFPAPYDAEIATVVAEPTGRLVTMKVAVVVFAGTVTLAGTVAAPVLLLDRLIVAPDDGAAALNVTVPVDVWPPVTLVGFSATDDTAIGTFTPSVAVTVVPE
jgi:hypothetical protein